MVAVADDQASAVLVPLVGQLGYVGVDFGLKRGGQHSPRAFADDLVDQGAVRGTAVGIDYAEHGRVFPTDVRSVGLLGDLQSITREGTPFASNPSPIHRS
ncbi:hypothetical protein GCM10023080_080400 [Streptomyces pseudoechinosporeus]